MSDPDLFTLKATAEAELALFAKPPPAVFVAVLDPAWGSDDGGGKRGASEHYDLHSPTVLVQQYRSDPRWRANGDALVFVWVTRLALTQGQAHALIGGLGLKVASDFVWAKVDEIACDNCKGTGSVYQRVDPVTCVVCDGTKRAGFVEPAMMGLGFWSRSEHEYLYVCRRGDIDVPPPSARPRSIIYAPRVTDATRDTGTANKTLHSAKPERAWTQVIEPIARAVAPGSRGIEWNARVRRRGWGAIGRLDGEDKSIRYEQGDD